MELRLIGRNLAHYHITASIGMGGMAEVYRATDTRLDREVALEARYPPPTAASICFWILSRLNEPGVWLGG